MRVTYTQIIIYTRFETKGGCLMLTKEELPACPVATHCRIGRNKWKLLIIRNLLGGTQRFNEMRRTIPGISRKC